MCRGLQSVLFSNRSGAFQSAAPLLHGKGSTREAAEEHKEISVEMLH